MKKLDIEIKADLHDSIYIPALECRASVNGIYIGQMGITYFVAWFHNGERKEAYLHSHEFKVVDQDFVK